MGYTSSALLHSGISLWCLQVTRLSPRSTPLGHLQEVVLVAELVVLDSSKQPPSSLNH